MNMILNDLLTKQNVFTKLLIKDGDKELPKELKVKVLRIRMALNKAKKAFDDEVKEFMDELLTPEFKDLNSKSDKTSDEEIRFSELAQTINSEYQVYISQKLKEEVDIIDTTLTDTEYSDIVEVNAGNNVVINGNEVSAVDFLEAVYSLFVKE